MNKKGFTTVELLITIVLVITIMATISSVTYTYRDRATYEETLSSLNTYKNTLTKIIYDDILNNNILSIESDDENNISLVKRDNSVIPISIKNDINEAYILYNNIKYVIPDSNYDLIKIYPIELNMNTEYNIYTVDIKFTHELVDKEFVIHFTIT